MITGISRNVNSPHLTCRQRDCAILAAKGMTSKEIARQLNIAPSTVDTHLATVLARYNLKKRAEISLLFDKAEDQFSNKLVISNDFDAVACDRQEFSKGGESPIRIPIARLISRLYYVRIDKIALVVILAFILWYFIF